MTTTTAPESVIQFLAAAAAGGWRVEARNLNDGYAQSWIVEITRVFEPGDVKAYVAADGEAYSVLRLVPTSYPGTTWGTTSDGVGGHVGLTHGHYRIAKSGVQARFAKALAKVLFA